MQHALKEIDAKAQWVLKDLWDVKKGHIIKAEDWEVVDNGI